MKIVVVACLVVFPSTCKTLRGKVDFLKSQTQCATAISEKAKQYPRWFVKSYTCEKT